MRCGRKPGLPTPRRAQRRSRSRFPMRLRVTAAGHRGAIHIRGEEPGGYLVAHDFEAPGGWWIYDVRVLTARQIAALTGVRLEGG